MLFPYAFALDTIPSTAEPGRVSQDIAPISPEPTLVPRKALATPPEPVGFPKEIASIKFQLKGIKLKGNERYTNQELLELFPYKIGATVTLGDIEKFVNAITLKYAKAGYLLSQAVIPEQEIKSGIITIQIIEGYVDKVTIEGDVSNRTKLLIKRYADKVLNKKPLNISELESTLLLANDIPGMEVKSLLTKSKATFAGTDLTLLVAHSKFDQNTNITYDNRGTRYIGPTRIIASAYLNTMLGDGATTGLRLAESGQWNEMRYIELEHKQYIGADGLMLDVDAQYTRTYPGFLLQGTNTLGLNKYFLLGAQYPLFRQHNFNLYVKGGFTYINSFLEQFFFKVYNDQIRTFQLGLTYDFLDSYRGSTQIFGYFTQGINFMGASQSYNLISRPGAKPNFGKFNLSAGRLQGLFSNYSLMLTFNGQYTNSSMYAYQQMGYGGLPFGDAYDPSEIIGDRGIEAKIELQKNTVFPWGSIPTQYFINYDGGVLWNIQDIGQPNRLAGTSLGFGVRATIFKYINLSLELAKPMDRKVAATAAIPSPGHNPEAWRGFFSVALTAL